MTRVLSTLPHRINPVTNDEFEAVQERLTLTFNSVADPGSGHHPYDRWNQFIPLTPQQAVDVLTRDLPSQTELEFIQMDKDGDGEVIIQSEKGADDPELGKMFKQEQSFYFSKNNLDSGSSKVDDNYQQQSLGRILYRNQIEFFYACGIERYLLYAMRLNGAYTWARLGFLPSEIEGASFARDVIEPAQKRYTALRQFLPEKDRKLIDSALKFKTPRDMWRIVDCRTDLRPFLTRRHFSQDFRRKGKVLRLLEENLSTMDAGDICTTLFGIYDRLTKRKKPVYIGQLLLSGLDWDAILDMTNPTQMKRAGKYVGGWKYIKFEPA